MGPARPSPKDSRGAVGGLPDLEGCCRASERQIKELLERSSNPELEEAFQATDSRTVQTAEGTSSTQQNSSTNQAEEESAPNEHPAGTEHPLPVGGGSLLASWAGTELLGSLGTGLPGSDPPPPGDPTGDEGNEGDEEDLHGLVKAIASLSAAASGAEREQDGMEAGPSRGIRPGMGVSKLYNGDKGYPYWNWKREMDAALSQEIRNADDGICRIPLARSVDDVRAEACQEF